MANANPQAVMHAARLELARYLWQVRTAILADKLHALPGVRTRRTAAPQRTARSPGRHCGLATTGPLRALCRAPADVKVCVDSALLMLVATLATDLPPLPGLTAAGDVVDPTSVPEICASSQLEFGVAVRLSLLLTGPASQRSFGPLCSASPRPA